METQGLSAGSLHNAVLGEFGMGTATGIASGGATWALTKAYFKFVLPKMRKMQWEGVDLTGRWSEEYEEVTAPKSPQNRHIIIDLVQTGCELSGTAIATDVADAPKRLGTSRFKVTGRVNQRFAHFTILSIDKSNYGVAQYLLDIDPDAPILIGVTSYWDRADNSLASATCKLIKQPS